jgi:uncharacterized membrane protein YoaK (UPF0700 family)
MYRLEVQDYVKSKWMNLWGLAAFQAGFINSLGFLACQRFVSHVTGFSTNVGISLGDGNYLYALELFVVPLFFLFGAWLNGYLTVSRISKNLIPRYDIISLIIPSILLILMSFGLAGYFGPFGKTLSFSQDFILLNSLTFICGIQNACFSTLTKGHIRTTHLTGLTTDFGTDLSLVISGSLPPEERELAIKKNWMRLITFASFSLGALFSALVDREIEYLSFLVPIATSLTFAYVFLTYKPNKAAGR